MTNPANPCELCKAFRTLHLELEGGVKTWLCANCLMSDDRFNLAARIVSLRTGVPFVRTTRESRKEQNP